MATTGGSGTRCGATRRARRGGRGEITAAEARAGELPVRAGAAGALATGGATVYFGLRALVALALAFVIPDLLRVARALIAARVVDAPIDVPPGPPSG
jgi:hypothetical protein